MDEAIEIVLLLYWANNGIWLSGLKSIIPSSKDIGQIICAKKINSKSVSIVIAVELLYWANNGIWLSGLKSSGLVVERH